MADAETETDTGAADRADWRPIALSAASVLPRVSRCFACIFPSASGWRPVSMAPLVCADAARNGRHGHGRHHPHLRPQARRTGASMRALHNMSEGLCMFDARERLWSATSAIGKSTTCRPKCPNPAAHCSRLRLAHRQRQLARDPESIGARLPLRWRGRAMHAEVISPDGRA